MNNTINFDNFILYWCHLNEQLYDIYYDINEPYIHDIPDYKRMEKEFKKTQALYQRIQTIFKGLQELKYHLESKKECKGEDWEISPMFEHRKEHDKIRSILNKKFNGDLEYVSNNIMSMVFEDFDT